MTTTLDVVNDRVATMRGTARLARPPRTHVADMACSLDFYLELGCEVGRAADGWALLRCGTVSFVLVQAPPQDGPGLLRTVHDGDEPWVRLGTRDVRTLRRRLLGDGLPVGAVHYPVHPPTGQILTRDPDRRPVAIEQLASGRLPASATRDPRIPQRKDAS